IFLRLPRLTCVLHVPNSGHPHAALSNPAARSISHFFEGMGKVWILRPHSNTRSSKLKASLFSHRGSTDTEGATLMNVDPADHRSYLRCCKDYQRGLSKCLPVPMDLISSDSDGEFAYTSMSDHPSSDNPSILIPPISDHKEIVFNNFPDWEDDRVFSDQPEAPISENTPYEPITLDEPVLTLPILESNSPVHVGKPHKEAL
ncbi:LOW QUALITY PROTEIN: hypothetical protein TorRG33x02_344210, partial [Trema orientale]